MASWLNQIRRRYQGNGDRTPHTRRPLYRRWRPSVELLEDRLAPTVNVSTFSLATGTVTFTGDGAGDALVLSVVSGQLSHNLRSIGTGNYANSRDIDPGSGVAVLTLGTGSAPLLTVVMGGGNDTLELDDTWTFTHKITYDGGTGSDTLQAPSSTNTFSMTGDNAGNLNGTAALTFTTVETLLGGTGNDTLIGQSVASTWSLGNTLTYSNGSASVTFGEFETLQGGSAADAFNLTGNDAGDVTATLLGGDGADTFTFSPAVQLTGSLDGQAGSDTLSWAAYTAGLTVSLTGGTANGYAGSESASFNGGTFSGIDTLVGGTRSDRLNGAGTASTWNLDTVQAFKNDSLSNSVTFSSFETLGGGTGGDTFNILANTTANLRGGSGTDTFNFSAGRTLTGTINGQGGGDSLNFSAYTTSLAITLTSSASNGFSGTDGVSSGFSGINTIVAGSGSDTLTGDDVASTWTLGATLTYNDGARTLTFANFENLQGNVAVDTFNVTANNSVNARGGNGNDLFVFSNGMVLTGTTDGEAGTDTLNLAAYTTSVSVTLTSSTANGFAGSSSVSASIAGIDSITGGSGADTLTGENVASTWALGATTTYNDGTRTLNFSAFDTFQGGSAADTFNITANSTKNLKGGGGNDAFVFSAGRTLTGTIDGEAGIDTLNLSGYTTNLAVALTSSTANGFAGTDGISSSFAGIDSVAAGSGSDTLTGDDVASSWTLAATLSYSDGSASLGFSAFETLQGSTAADTFNVQVNTTAALKGGSGADAFVFSAGRTLTGTIDGEAGTDTLNLAAYTTSLAITLTSSTANGFSGTDSVSSGFSGLDAVTAGSGSDTLTGDDVASTWTLGATLTYSDGSRSLDFANFETAQGNTAADSFNISANNTLHLKGGAGGDSFAFSAGRTLTGTLDGEGGSDTLNLAAYTTARTVTLTDANASGFLGTDSVSSGFSGIDSVTGGSGTDTLAGDDVASTWNLAAAQIYVTAGGTLGFAGFDVLQGNLAVDAFNVQANTTASLKGGANNDSFNFSAGRTLNGTLDGEGGTDTFNLTAYTTAVNVTLTTSAANGFAGTDSVTSGFSGMDSIAAGSGSDTLTGENVSNTWDLDGTPTYNDGSRTLDYSGFETLAGGTATDTFNVTANTTANLKGGGGSDAFVLSAGRTLTGTLDGEAGADTLNLGAYTTNLGITLTSGAANGFAGTDGVSSGFSGIDSIAAGSGSDTLTGDDVTSIWALAAARTYSDGSRSLDFTSFETLQGSTGADTFNITANTTAILKGGSGADTFVFSDGRTLTGTIAGEGGSDTLNYSAYTTPVTVTLSGSTANGFTGSDGGVSSGFTGIDSISGGAANTFVGEDVDGTWTLGATQTYNDGISTLTLANFATLQGGSARDTFSITANTTANLLGGADTDTFTFAADGVVLTGTLDGQAGTDTLSYAAYTTSIDFNLAAAIATGTQGISGIENLIGGSATDTLVADNVANTWAITNTNQGSITPAVGDLFTFTSIGNLTGGSGADTFTFSDGKGVTGTVRGGSGQDTLNLASFSAANAVSFNVTANNAGNVSSGAIAFSFAAMENLTGGTGDDGFVLSTGRTISGTLAGGGGTDTLNFAAFTTGVRVNLASAWASGVKSGSSGGIGGIENVTGGAGNDILIGDSNANVLNGNAGNNVLTAGGGNDTLQGGSGRDILVGGNGSDLLAGGGDDDLLISARSTHDSTLAALVALMAEWSRLDADYTTRIGHLDGSLTDDPANGSLLLNAATIFDDAGAVDILTGDAGTDWFWAAAGVADIVTDLDGIIEVRTTI